MKQLQMMKTTTKTALIQILTPPNENMGTEGVDIMRNETEEMEIEGVDYENEEVDSDN